MNKIAIVMTGGTITMKIFDPSHGAQPMHDPSSIIEMLKNKTGFNDLIIEEFSQLPSPSMNLDLMSKLKLRIDELLARDDVDGVIVTHGTDTLEETAFYLDVVHQSEKPIIVTGAMKNTSQIGYDGFTNLISSVYVARHPESKNKGVLVVMNYEIHAAFEVTKTHTLNLDTFKSLSFGPLGIIDDHEVIYYRLRTRISYTFNNLFLGPVVLIKTYAGMEPLVLNLIKDQDVKGVVIEALGRGNVPPQIVPSVEGLIQNNIPVIIVSRVPSGRVFDTYGYYGGGKDLIERGAIFGSDLSGIKARILLMIALGNNVSLEALKELFTYQ
jgi:L-asparaginase